LRRSGGEASIRRDATSTVSGRAERTVLHSDDHLGILVVAAHPREREAGGGD
jgi:hypothetical protein